MADCECLEKCAFLNEALKQMPASAALYKKNYCQADNAKCARYMVFKTLGKGRVPLDLFPNQTERALQIVAENPLQANQHSRWTLSENDLAGLTPLKARDLLLKCFFEAQKETLVQAEKRIFGSADEERIKADTLKMTKSLATTFHVDFENPTKTGLLKLLEEMVKMSLAWGTPQEIVDYHKNQIVRMLDTLHD